MDDLSNQPLNDEPSDRQSLEQMGRSALVPQESADYRTELYARLRHIIDNATESIRALKDENASLATQKAEMADRIGMLEQRIRTVTAELADDERALRQSAEVLAQELQGTPAASAPVSVPPPPPMPDAEPMPASEAPPMMEEAAPAAVEETGPIPQPGPPEPPARDEDERVIAPRIAPRTDGTYTVVAYPFVRFSDLGQFQAALQKLTGVHDVQVRRFAQGTLEMHIGYSGGTNLATTLRTMAAEVEDVREEEPFHLRVRLRTSQD